jgi:general secretion pathway protein M
MKKFKLWFEQLQPRERQLVTVGLIVFGIFLPYQLIWSPLVNHAEYLQQQVVSQTGQLQWMQESLQEIRQLQGSAAVKQTGPLLSQVEQTADQNKLRGSIRKIQPEGERGVRIWMDNAAFDDVLMWLQRLQQQHSVEVVDLSVERQPDPGRVNLRLSLEAL